MKAFTFAPHAFATEFKERGYVLVKGGVTEELLTFAKAQLAQCLSSGQNELASKEIKNKKKQYLFKLPEDDEFLPELTSAIGTLTGLPVAQMTLSERHIKVYDDNASSLPPLLKDCSMHALCSCPTRREASIRWTTRSTARDPKRVLLDQSRGGVWRPANVRKRRVAVP
jgi:hypothetical protein